MKRALREIIWDLRGNRGNAVLSGISLVVAIIALIGIQATASVGRDIIVARSEQQSGRAITVSAQLPPQLLSQSRLSTIYRVLDHDITESGSRYALVVSSNGGVSTATSPAQTGVSQSLYLVAGQLNQVRRMPVLSGQWLAPDGDALPGGIVVNQAAQLAFGSVGDEVQLTTDSAYPSFSQRIIGVVADGSGTPDIYGSLTTTLLARPTSVHNQGITLEVQDSRLGTDAITAEVRQAGADLGLAAGDISPLRQDGVGGLAAEVKLIGAAFSLVALIALLVAGLGMLNIGLANVRERSRELTIRRAVGATAARIGWLVVGSTVVIGVAASLVAVAIAWIAVSLIAPALLSPADALSAPAFPWQAAILGVAAGFLASLISSIIPAMRTIRLDIATALRD